MLSKANRRACPRANINLAQTPVKLLLLPGFPVFLRFCVHPLRVKSVCCNLLGLLKLSPACLQSHMLWCLVFLLQDPQAGGPDVGLRTLTPVGELLQYCSPVYELPQLRVWYLIVL